MVIEIAGYQLSPLEEELYILLKNEKRLTFTRLNAVNPKFMGAMGKLTQRKVARIEKDKLPNPGRLAPHKSGPKVKREKFLIFIGEGSE